MTSTAESCCEPSCELFVHKDEHKFSCAHMTIFPDGSKERLHGHNFRLAAAVELDPEYDGEMLDFGRVKQVLASVCAELREHLLLPASSPSVRLLGRTGDEIEFTVCGRRYLLPSDEVLMLPVTNVVVEQLAGHLWTRIHDALESELGRAHARSLAVTVTEGPGQGATWKARVGGNAPGRREPR